MEQFKEFPHQPCPFEVNVRCWRVAALTRLVNILPDGEQKTARQKIAGRITAAAALPPTCSENCWRIIDPRC